MNTTNRSTGFTPFQLRFGWSPRVLPPLVPNNPKTPTNKLAHNLLGRMQGMVSEAQDNLISAKISQAYQANKSQSLNFPFKTGDRVLLSTSHQWQELRAGHPNRVAKFMPQFNGPFYIKSTDEKHSTATLDLPNFLNVFPVFHASELRPFTENNDSLFPSRALTLPGPTRVFHQQNHRRTTMWKKNPLLSIMARWRTWRWSMAASQRTSQLQSAQCLDQQETS